MKIPEIKISEILTKVLIAVLLLSSFALGSFLAFDDKAAAAATSYGFAAFCLILFLLSRFKRFTAFGVEGELWDDKQREAENLIRAMKDILILHSKVSLNTAVRIGRWDSGLPYQELVNLLNGVEKKLSEVGVPDADLKNIRKPFFQYVSIDIAYSVANQINSLIKEKADSYKKELDQKFSSPITDVETYNAEIGKWRQILDQVVNNDELVNMCRNGDVSSYLQKKLLGADALSTQEKEAIHDSISGRLNELSHIHKNVHFGDKSIWFALEKRQN